MEKVKELLYNLREEKEKGAYFVHSHENINFTCYRDLFRQSLWMKNYLYERGIRPKDEVIISMDNSEWFYITLWACILGDFIAAPVSIKRDDIDKLSCVLEVCHNAFIVTDDEALSQEINQGELSLKDCICWNTEMTDGLESGLKETTYTNIEDAILGDEECDSDIVYIQLSSGSTSDIKGVGITNLGIIQNVDNIYSSRHLYGEEVFVTWIPLYHNFGLFLNMFIPIRHQHNAHIIDTQYVVKDPVFYLDYCNRVKGTIASGTNFYLNFIIKLLQEKGVKREWDFSFLHTMFLGAEPISINLCNQFAEYMKESKFQRFALSPAYGLTEGTLAVSVTTDEDCIKKISVSKESMSIGNTIEIISDDNPLASEIISVGKPLPAFKLKVVDLDGNTLEDGRVGLIFIAGNCVLNNYYNRERDENFIGEWFNTGDIGFIYDGNLHITARYKEMFIYNGKNYYDNDIEKYIQKLDIFKEERIIIHGYRKNVDDVNDNVICFIQGNTPMEILVSKIKSVLSHMNNMLGIYIDDFVLVDNIPMTVSGKVQRYKLIKNYIRGDYNNQIGTLAKVMEEANNIIECDVSAIEDFIAETLEDVVDHQLDYSGSFMSMGLDSLQIAKLHMAINIKYGDCISIAELFEYTTIETLAEYIVERVHVRKEMGTLIG
ncbi:hypothetical protein AN1V17_10190 [Vallitalea sediminicola]